MATTAPAIDLISHGAYSAGHPVDQYRWLRATAPVHWHDEPRGPGFWAVTSHPLVNHISRTPEVFSSSQGTMMYTYPDDELAVARNVMLHMDPPMHSRYRKIVSGQFIPSRADAWRDNVADIARQIVDEVCERGECELMGDVAGKLPSYVIADLIGMPRAEGVRLYELTETMHMSPDVVSDADRMKAITALSEFATSVRESKRANPGDDLASRLVAAEVDGESLSDVEFHWFFILLVNAGGDTTRNLLGGAMVSLMERPQLLERLRAEADTLLPTAVDELLRFQSPVIHMRRTATQDVELGGQQIRAGDKVVMFYGAANRDEAAFDRPDELVLDRTPNDHVSFGAGGTHYCLGSHFGRIEVTAMMKEILTRLPDIRPAGEATWLESNFISGPTSVPVTFRPTPRS
ncbi:MAG: cytochrome P450 [Pseudonocardia sp.]|nr:cytochrome P450 [Pseudonocardia sp.]